MDLTIVIVNWNGGELLQNCLRSIRASRTSFLVKVIVVDNDSGDGSREQAQHDFPEFHIFNSGANLGFGRANNLARGLVDTELVLFLNPDTELRHDSLERSVQCLREHNDVGALGCKMLYPDGAVQEQGLQWFPSPLTIFMEMVFGGLLRQTRLRRWFPVIDPNRSACLRKLYGGYVLARKDVLDAAGWFDDRYFMYAEDVDLSRTIQSLGWKLFYCAEAEIVHACGGTSDKAPSGFSILMKNQSIHQLIRKYQGPFAAALYRIVVLIASLMRALPLMVWAGLRAAMGRRTRRCANALLKSKLVILWALGLKHAVVAHRPDVISNHSPSVAALPKSV